METEEPAGRVPEMISWPLIVKPLERVRARGELRPVPMSMVAPPTVLPPMTTRDVAAELSVAMMFAAHSHRVMATSGPTAGPKLVVNFDPLPHSSWAAKAAREAADTISAAMMRLFIVVKG